MVVEKEKEEDRGDAGIVCVSCADVLEKLEWMRTWVGVEV